MLLFNYFHKSRLYYGLPAFIDQTSAINRVYRAILYNIKILLKLPKRTNINNGVLQGSLLSPILFNIYINDLIKDLDYIAFEILAYADDLCVLCQDKNELIRVIKRIDLWSRENGINVNRKKSGIFVVKGEEQYDNIEGYPILNEYKYLGILIDKKLNIQNHIGLINKKLSEYFRKNYFLNQRYFSVKSIMLLFNYFHKSRLYYGLPAFID